MERWNDGTMGGKNISWPLPTFVGPYLRKPILIIASMPRVMRVFWVQCSVFSVQGSGFSVQGFSVQCSVFSVQGFRGSGFRLDDSPCAVHRPACAVHADRRSDSGKCFSGDFSMPFSMRIHSLPEIPPIVLPFLNTEH